MPMQDPAEIVQARAAPLKIFFPPNDDLRPQNTLLHRSAVVLLGSNVRLSQMSFRIANSLATSLGRHPKEFTVSETDPSFGEYLVTFTSNMLRNMACYIGAFMVAPGVQVQLREWTPNLAMVRDPTTHKARIKLHGLPFTYWNFSHVNQLISRFGYAEMMSQIVTNHNFKVLQVLVACHDPADIPPSLWLTKNPYSKIGHVEMEGWVHNSNIPFFPPNEGDDDDDDTSSDDTADGNDRHQVRPNNNMAHRSGQQASQGPNGGQGRQGGCNGCQGQDRRGRILTNGHAVVQGHELESSIHNQTGGSFHIHNGQGTGKEIARETMEILQSSCDSSMVNQGRQTTTMHALHLTQYDEESLISRLSPEERQNDVAPLLFQNTCNERRKCVEQLLGIFQTLACQVAMEKKRIGR